MDVKKRDQYSNRYGQMEFASATKRKAESPEAENRRRPAAPQASEEDLRESKQHLGALGEKEIGLYSKDIVRVPIPVSHSTHRVAGPTKLQLEMQRDLDIAKTEDEYVKMFQEKYRGTFLEHEATVDTKETKAAWEELRKSHVRSYDWRVDPYGKLGR